MSESLYFARQPILDLHGNTYAYELLYRTSSDHFFEPIKNGRLATAQVLVYALNLAGLNKTLGETFAFVNIDEELLMDEMLFSIPKEQFVLEILENVVINERIIERIKELKEHGYRFALDDADCSKEYIINFQPIFEYVDIVKLDILTLQEENLPKFLALFKRFKLKILAEKVETQEEFDKYKALGCDYFQGYFFARPDIIENKAIDPAQLLILRLIRHLQSESATDEICHTFEQNAALTLQLLRFVNSAAFGFRASIKSIRQAILLLGPNQLKSWLLLISYANPSKGIQGLQNPLLTLAQTRSNMMQTFCKGIYKHTCSKTVLEKSAFIGLLSLIEALMHAPIQDILNELNVDEEIIQTLVYNTGELGKILQLVCAVERFDTQCVDEVLDTLPLSREEFSAAVEEAYVLTEAFSSDLNS